MSKGGRRKKPAKGEPLAVVGIGASAGPIDQAGARAPEESAAVHTPVDQQLLDHFAPAAVVVRQDGAIVRFYGAMERYITLPSGDDTLDVRLLARPALTPALRSAFHDAVRGNHDAVVETMDRGRGRTRAQLRITVKRVKGATKEEPLWLIIFEALAPSPVAHRAGTPSQRRVIRQVEAEARTARKQQQHLIEQLEIGKEDLQNAHQDILSMNEELQSANEELVTSTEELESINEELSTLNGQLQEKVQELTVVNDDLANLLTSTDIATVFLDPELRIKRSTAAAAQVFNLRPSDTGRPMHHIASTLADIDLSAVARAVLKSATPLAREVTTPDGRHYILSVRPYLTDSKTEQGVVLTLVDVSLLKVTERALGAAREQISGDLRRMTRLHEASMRIGGSGDLRLALQEMLRAAVEITDAEMGYIQRFDETEDLAIAAQIGFDPPFLDFFARVGADVDSASRAAMASHQRVVVESLAESPIFEGSPSLPVLVEAGVRAMQATPLYDRSGTFLGTLCTHYRAPHRFEHAERRWLDLLARPAGDIIHRRQTEALSSVATGALEQRVADRTKWLTLMHKVTHAINDAATWHEGLRLAMRWICETEDWQLGYVYLPDQADPDTLVPSISYFRDERMRPFHVVAEHCRFTRGQSLPGRVYADGRAEWVNGHEAVLSRLPLRRAAAQEAGLQAVMALPVSSGHHVIAVLELFSDQPHARNDLLANLMNDMGAQIGKVLERERSTGEMADLVWRQQQALLHTLHDSLGQTLTGLGMLASGLTRRVEPEGGASAVQIGQLAQQALDQVRQLSRGLFPIEIDAEGLRPSLRELASATETFHGLHVTVDCPDPAPVSDGRVATQLYRIAQEAVTNAVKHAKATSIRIELRAERGVVKLRLRDDGIGITGRASKGDGLGLRIMMHRATSIGASLVIEPMPAGGTVVACTLRLSSPAPVPPAVAQMESS